MFDTMFVIVAVFIGIGFVFVFGVILVRVFTGVAQWADNNAQPVRSVPARVVAKRTETSGGMNNGHVWTTYYATFEMASGERREFTVSGPESGLLVEGDAGTLTHQGTRYQGFDRHG